jgi:hypothetical protein
MQEGNGDGRLTPGESAELAVELKNYGNGDVLDVTATLEAISADVTVTNTPASYGDISGGGRATSDDTFSISVPPTRANGETVYLRLVAADSHQNRWESVLALEVATPVLACELLGVEEGAAGDGDGLPEPGETATLFVRVENQGLATAKGVVASLTSDDAFIDVTESTRDLGTLLPGASRNEALGITIASACPTPRFPTISTVISAAGGYGYTGVLDLTVGPTGFADDVEFSGVGWSTPDEENLWHRSSHRAHDGSTSWYCGIEGQWTYPNDNTSVLRSVPFSLGRDPVLSLWVWYDLALYGTTGLFVEVGDGIQWEKMDFIGSGGALNPLLMGHDWAEYTYDLSRYPPGSIVQLRFRFVSDSEAAGEGVYIDDVEVRDGGSMSDVVTFIRGDADSDSRVTITDPIVILNHLFLQDEAPTCFDAADANDDAVIDLSDAVRILLFLFGGSAFDPPLGLCGSDATPDALDCRATPPCR